MHQTLFLKSLQLLSRTLQPDIYRLRDPGIAIKYITPPLTDPLATARYSGVYWVNHLLDAHASNALVRTDDLQDGGTIYSFLRENYLYRLEALSLAREMPKGVLAVESLCSLVQVRLHPAITIAIFTKISLEHIRRISVKSRGSRYAAIHSVAPFRYRERSSTGLCLYTDFQPDSELDATIISE